MSRVKICGLFRIQDAEYVNEARPDYAGFVFARSKRQVLPVQAAEIRCCLTPGIRTVGVFVNEPPEYIARISAYCQLDLIQLHGQETEEEIRRIHQMTGLGVIKAIHVEEAAMWDESEADYLLIDHGAGGTGENFDWTALPKLSKPFFLAGGIRLHNIAKAAGTGAFALDISSGAETDGMKDREKICRIVQEVRRSGGDQNE